MIILLTLSLAALLSHGNPVGYSVTNVSSYTPLRRSGRSTLYEVQAEGVKDGRPLKVLELIGSHYKVGYDYGTLLGKEIQFTYQTFMKSVLPKRWELIIMEWFLDWQYNAYVGKNIQDEFKEELLGIRDAGYKFGYYDIHRLVKRVLVVSSYPGGILNDILYSLLDEFTRALSPKKLQSY